MQYKRISRGKANYALFPINQDKYEIIKKHGRFNDYYESIYTYTDKHYSKYIAGLRAACDYTGVEYDEEKILNVDRQVRSKLRKAIDAGKTEAESVKDAMSVRGVTDITIDKLVFDFDAEDIGAAQKDAIEVVKKLQAAGFKDNNILVCFSGSKGFSVEAAIKERRLTRDEFERIIDYFTKGLKTADPSVKDEQRLFRIPLTKHQSSGLFKTPLTVRELKEFNIDYILEYAAKQNGQKVLKSWVPAPMPKAIEGVLETAVEETQEPAPEAQALSGEKVDLSDCPKWMAPEKYALQQGDFAEGNRNEAFMILAATYKDQGFSKDVAFAMLQGVADVQAVLHGGKPYSDKKIKSEIINQVYSKSWRGGTYSRENSALLSGLAEKYGLLGGVKVSRIVTLEDGWPRFEEYARNLDKNRIQVGIPEFDDNVEILVQRATGIVGAPSSGKTALVLNFLDNVLEGGEIVLFQSLDMGENDIIERFLARHCSHSAREIRELIHKGITTPELEYAKDMLRTKYKNLVFNYDAGTTVEDINDDINRVADRFGKQPKVVVVDYLEKIYGTVSDDLQRNGYNARVLTDIARKNNLAVFTLLQTQKMGGDASVPRLSMRDVKGSSVIEQDHRLILGVWRPGFNVVDPEDDKFMSVAILKANGGKTGRFDFAWDGRSGKIRGMNDMERAHFEDVEAAAKERIELERKLRGGF